VSENSVPWRLRLPPKHPAGLSGAAEVRSVAYLRALQRMRDAAQHNGLVLLLGPSGTGKTFAALSFLEQARADGRTCVYLTTMAAAQSKTITEQLLEALTLCPVKGENYQLSNQLMDLFDLLHPIVVIDEAHRARHLGVEQLLFLRERSGPCWTLILAGNGLRETCGRDASLASRARSCAVAFAPLADAELLKALRAFHPLLADAEPRLLQRIDERYCHGEWRAWASLTAELVTLNTELRAAGKPAMGALTARACQLVAGRLGWDAWEVPS
jgi:hypothetical protein